MSNISTSNSSSLSGLNVPASTSSLTAAQIQEQAITTMISGLQSLFGSDPSRQAVLNQLASLLMSLVTSSTNTTTTGGNTTTTTQPNSGFTGPTTPATTKPVENSSIKIPNNNGEWYSDNYITAGPGNTQKYHFKVNENQFGTKKPLYLEFGSHSAGNDISGSPTFTLTSPSGKTYSGMGRLAVPYEEGKWKVDADFSSVTQPLPWKMYVNPSGFAMKR